MKKGWRYFIREKTRIQLAAGTSPEDTKLSFSMMAIKDPLCSFFASAMEDMQSPENQEGIRKSWAMAGLDEDVFRLIPGGKTNVQSEAFALRAQKKLWSYKHEEAKPEELENEPGLYEDEGGEEEI